MEDSSPIHLVEGQIFDIKPIRSKKSKKSKGSKLDVTKSQETLCIPIDDGVRRDRFGTPIIKVQRGTKKTVVDDDTLNLTSNS